MSKRVVNNSMRSSALQQSTAVSQSLRRRAVVSSKRWQTSNPPSSTPRFFGDRIVCGRQCQAVSQLASQSVNQSRSVCCLLIQPFS